MNKTADESGLGPAPLPENATDGSETARVKGGAGKALPAEAKRALAEAAARRAKAAAVADKLPPERGGRDGPDPARYGDWEINGRAVDF